MDIVLEIVVSLLLLLSVTILILGVFDPYNSTKYTFSAFALIVVSAGLFALEEKTKAEKAKEYAKELKNAKSLICEIGWFFPEKVYIEKFKVRNGEVIDLKTGKIFSALDCKPEGEKR